MSPVDTIEIPVTEYQDLSEAELFERTVAAKQVLGDRVLILGHNYQRDDVIVHADLRGDSLMLSKLASEQSHYPNIVLDRKSVV